MSVVPIIPARLEYSAGTLYSSGYGDIYHSADGAIEQARHVFLQGCGLPQAWARRASFVILETGFGAGLNFLATWAAWRDDPARCERLHFISAEKHPFTAADLSSLHATWPEFARQSQELRSHWPMLTPGFHRIELDGGRVHLTLMLGDATDCISQLQAKVEAIYLDGFAPDRNPDIWQPALFQQLARVATRVAVLASYTVAASVREGLTAVGFCCEKREGYGRKRHRLSAQFKHASAHENSATTDAPVRAIPRHVAVIGAGVAGCAVAQALAQRGIQVTVLEQAAAPAQGASGNPVAVFRPLPSRDDNQASRLTRAAFLYSLRTWGVLGETLEWSRCGVLQCAKDSAHAQKLAQTLADNAAPEEFARWVDAAEASQLAQWHLTEPGVFYPNGGWIVPASLCRLWLAHPNIHVRFHSHVSVLDTQAARCQLLDTKGSELGDDVDAVVIANACDAVNLLPELKHLQAVRGQVNIAPADTVLPLARVIAREGYVSPSPDGRYIIGATYEYDTGPSASFAPSRRGDAENQARLEAILPGVRVGDFPGRASVRAVMPDRFPLLGALQNRPHVFIATGYASRGVVLAGLLAETLASIICDEPLPLERDLVRAMRTSR
jgi:tRNA 5-methylaminomethyl-2-thiouridine biosynthesis bifunctional protein